MMKQFPSSYDIMSGLSSIRGHHFYATAIDSSSTIIDLGSHLGEFSAQVSHSFNCRCYAIEALPKLYEKIKETELVTKFNYAISGSNEEIKLHVEDNLEFNHIERETSQVNGPTINVTGKTLSSFVQEQNIQQIDLLKVDIEGAEVELFNSLSDKELKKIKQISVEFHDFVFKEIRGDVEKIKERLKSLGFEYIVFSISTNGDVLFINKSVGILSIPQLLYIKFIAKYTRAIKRKVSKIFPFS
jgi:FkbM family methyltransferase